MPFLKFPPIVWASTVPHDDWYKAYLKSRETFMEERVNFPWERYYGQYSYMLPMKEANERIKMNKKERFLKAGGKFLEAKQNIPEKFDCTNVLSNADSKVWVGKERTVAIADMPDEWLISVVRWLVKNAEFIRESYLERVPGMLRDTSTYRMVKSAQEIHTIISHTVVSWYALRQEIIKRFDYEAFHALVNGA